MIDPAITCLSFFQDFLEEAGDIFLKGIAVANNTILHSTMPPKRKAEVQNTDYSPATKKQKVTNDNEIRLPIEVIGEILSYLDYDEATIMSRVAVDWRSAYKADVLLRFRQQVF